MNDEREPPEPEVELAPIDPAEQDALVELEREAGESEERESGPLPRWGVRAASDWPSDFPAEPSRPNRGLFEELVPTRPPSAAESRPSPRNVGAEVSGLLPLGAADVAARSSRPAATTSDRGDEPESRPSNSGLISSILGPVEVANPDEGALAALRTLPRRAKPDRPSALRDDPEAMRERMEWLLLLASRSAGSVRARLQTAAAELMTRRGEPDRAFAAYRAAVAADPTDRIALRRLRRHQLQRGLTREAAALFRAEAELSPNEHERNLALCAAAELEPNGPIGLDPSRVSSLLSGLWLAQRAFRAARSADLAAALSGSAACAATPEIKSMLWNEAGRALEHDDEIAAAETCFSEAGAADPASLGAALGWVRCRALSDERAEALAALAAASADLPLAAELRRQHGLALLDERDDARAALDALRGQDSARGYRTLLRAAERAHDGGEQIRALEGWAQRSGGSERGLALIELAALLAKQERRAEALTTLRIAQASGAPLALLRSVSDELLRTEGDAASLDGLTDQREDALRTAAKLARDPARTAEERDALLRLQPEDGAAVASEVLMFDVAAELSDTPQLMAALARDAARWPIHLRIGPLLAALDLDPAPSPEREPWRALQALAHGQPTVTRSLAARADSPEVAASAWLAEAQAASGEPAAFASMMAGRYLEQAGNDPSDAYADSLDAARGYPSGAFGLELAARARADLAALERVHRELASTTESSFERCARRVRLGLLNADSDLEGATRWLELAAEDQPGDAVLDELLIRLSMDQSPAAMATRLQNLAAAETQPAFARALQLRAAAACEDARRWDEAIASYRALLRETPDDAFVDAALLGALERAERYAELATEFERRLTLAEAPLLATPLLEDWAAAERLRGSERARTVLETLLDREPRHVPALRALERFAMRDRDDVRLVQLSLRLSELLEQPAARGAELRLALRFSEWLGGDGDAALLRAEGHVRELWHALAISEWAERRGDRSRIYDALRALSDLLPAPIERTAYALRAAEVMENAAPERAALELGPQLLAAPEHPLAIEQLARLLKAGGNARAAAENFERAGFLASTQQRGVPLFYAAGVLFQDELGELERARENLQRVVQTDVLFADTFVRLRALLGELGRALESSELLEIRLAAPIDPALAASLELEQATIALQLGDRIRAKRALAASLRRLPEQPSVWRSLAELQTQDGQHREAAEAMVQWARIARDDAELAEALWRLGTLYDEQLPDPRRAELALSRAVELLPDEPRVLERLFALQLRERKLAEAVRSLDGLIALHAHAPTREHYVVQRAELLIDLGRQEGAERALDEARRASPASMPVLRALSSLYERQGDRAALTLHLQRSCHALRAAIEMEPEEIANWLGLCELLEARQRPEGVALVAAMARTLGLDHPNLPDETFNGVGRDALRDVVQKRIAVGGPLDPLRTLFREHAHVLSPCLPFAGPANASSLEHAPQVLRAVEQLFGIHDLQLLATNLPICTPLSDDPLTVCVGRSLYLQATDPERFFLITRAVAVARYGCTLLVRALPERILLVLHALWAVADPAHSANVLDAQEQARVIRELSSAIPSAARARVHELINELMGHEDLNPRRLVASAFDYGSRLALAVSGDVNSALRALLRLRGKPPEEFTQRELFELCRIDAPIRALLSFAISEVYLDARRQWSPFEEVESS